MSGFFGVGIGPHPIGRTGTPADPVPVAGAELVVNGGMEGTYVGGVAPSWSKLGLPTVAESADAYAGSAAQSIADSAASSNNSIWQLINVPAPGWNILSVYGKRGAGTGALRLLLLYNSAIITDWTAESWSGKLITYYGDDTFLYFYTTGSAPGLFDEVSFKRLTLSSLFSTRAYASADCDLSVAVTRTAGTQAGFVARLDSASSPANFIIAYLDGASNVKVDKCVSGTYTNVISGAVTYGSTKRLRLVCSGTSVSAYYDGTQVGSTVTVSDAGIVGNVRHGKFSTYASNTFAGYVAA